MTAPAWTYRYRATTARVIDADTLAIKLDMGIRMTAEIPVRLARCNAAEKTTPAGQAGITFVNRWIALNADAEGWLAVTTKRNPGDPHGRWLAEVENLAGTKNLTDDLVTAGFAVKWNGRGVKPVPPDLPTLPPAA